MSSVRTPAENYDRDTASQNPHEYMNPGLLQELSLNRLTSGLPYQRAINERAVQKLIRSWDPRFLDPLVVSYRDGKYYLIDGQHRAVAIQRMYGNDSVKVRCIVHTGLTYADEAELFYRLDRCEKKLSYSQSVNALLQSGANAELNDISSRMEKQGFAFASGKGAYGDNKVRATRAMVETYRLLGREAFSRMLALLRNTWNGTSDSLCALMLSGMALFLKTYETQLNDRTFIIRMSGVPPAAITRKAQADFSTNRNALRCARVLLEYYNKGVRRGNKLNPNILC